MHSSSLRRQPGARSAQSGFTLVELITVILILGVLATVALPRYADLQGKARASKVLAVAGSMKTIVGLVKATALVTPVSCATATGTSITLEGLSIDLNHCYPQALGFGAGVLGAANVPSTDNWVVDASHVGAAAAGSVVQIDLSDAATPTGCSITYTAAADISTPPVVATTVTGC